MYSSSHCLCLAVREEVDLPSQERVSTLHSSIEMNVQHHQKVCRDIHESDEFCPALDYPENEYDPRRAVRPLCNIQYQTHRLEFVHHLTVPTQSHFRKEPFSS